MHYKNFTYLLIFNSNLDNKLNKMVAKWSGTKDWKYIKSNLDNKLNTSIFEDQQKFISLCGNSVFLQRTLRK